MVEAEDRPKLQRPRCLALVVAGSVAALGVCIAAQAAPVHVRVDRRSGVEFGAGYTVGRESECFIVVPLHVVQFAATDAITITDTQGRSASARVVKEVGDFDAALLRVTDGASVDCPAEWSDGSKALEAIGSAPFLVSRKVDDNGRVIQMRFFAASASREQVELQPYQNADELREGDSGSSLYAGSDLVGMITSVDTQSRTAIAITQSQIHGLFGPDVLPAGRKRAVVGPFLFRRYENAYATTAAREYLSDTGSMEILSLSAGEQNAPSGADYAIAGEVLQVSSTQKANPDYQAPARQESGGIGDRLLRGLQRAVESEVNDALEKNSTARYIRTFNVDVQIKVERLKRGEQILNIESRSYEYPVENVTVADLQNQAITRAVRDALASTVERYGLLD